MPRSRQIKTAEQKNVTRTARGEVTRAKLVKAAKQVFETDGMLDSRISDISKRAKVSYGTFYHYFDSKEDLFREVAEAQENRLTAPPGSGDQPRSSGSLDDRIRDANRCYLERYRAEAALMRTIEQASRYDPLLNSARMASQRRIAERSEASITRLQAQKRADPRINPSIAADALGSMVARFAELWMTQGYRDYDFEDVVEQLSILWSNAIGTHPERS